MSLRRGLFFLLCVLGLSLLALFAGEKARAATTPTWKDFAGKNLSPVTDNDACPSGELRFVPSADDKTENLLTIGAATSFQWKKSAKPEVEQTPGSCRTTTTAKGSSSSVEVVTLDEKCPESGQNRGQTETLRIVNEQTVEYRRDLRDGKGKSTGKILCTLKVKAVSK